MLRHLSHLIFYTIIKHTPQAVVAAGKVVAGVLVPAYHLVWFKETSRVAVAQHVNDVRLQVDEERSWGILSGARLGEEGRGLLAGECLQVADAAVITTALGCCPAKGLLRDLAITAYSMLRT